MKVGIIGLGSMGRTHARNLKHIDGVTISAICGVSVEAAQRFKNDMDIDSTIYTDFDTMLASEECDALYFCLPPSAHNGEVIKAANRGIHVFLEKPIALTSAKAKPIVAAIEKNGVVSQVGHQMRFRQSIQKLYAMIKNGSAGKPTIFQGRFWCNIGSGPKWWARKDKSGGQMLEQTVHIYDLALSLFGDAEKATGIVSNILHQDDDRYEIEDTSIGLITFTNGAVATISGSNCSVPVHFFSDFQIGFEHVSLEYKSTGQQWVAPDEATLLYDDDKVETIIEDQDVYLLEDQDFINAIATGTEAQIPARASLKSIRVIEEILNNQL